MSVITAASIIDKAAKLLMDVNNVKWTRSELLGWINDAQRQIVIMSPNATNKVATIKLVAGTRQSIPSDGWTLLNIIRYMGTDGTKPGRAVRLASYDMMDSFNPKDCILFSKASLTLSSNPVCVCTTYQFFICVIT